MADLLKRSDGSTRPPSCVPPSAPGAMLGRCAGLRASRRDRTATACVRGWTRVGGLPQVTDGACATTAPCLWWHAVALRARRSRSSLASAAAPSPTSRAPRRVPGGMPHGLHGLRRSRPDSRQDERQRRCLTIAVVALISLQAAAVRAAVPPLRFERAAGASDQGAVSALALDVADGRIATHRVEPRRQRGRTRRALCGPATHARTRVALRAGGRARHRRELRR